uniref:RNA-directed RNA polymerase n=1 Tax=Heterorhabditis bacteriophora TaxID=37862 RepID=A0A1I7WLY4_HETBA
MAVWYLIIYMLYNLYKQDIFRCIYPVDELSLFHLAIRPLYLPYNASFKPEPSLSVVNVILNTNIFISYNIMRIKVFNVWSPCYMHWNKSTMTMSFSHRLLWERSYLIPVLWTVMLLNRHLNLLNLSCQLEMEPFVPDLIIRMHRTRKARGVVMFVDEDNLKRLLTTLNTLIEEGHHEIIIDYSPSVLIIDTGCAKSSDTDVKSHNFMIKTAFETKIYADIHKIRNNNLAQLVFKVSSLWGHTNLTKAILREYKLL